MHEVEFVPLELLRSRATRRIGALNDACTELHMPVVMRVQVTVHPHRPALVVGALSKPRHRVAVPIEPYGRFVVVGGRLAAHARVCVEAVRTVLGRWTASGSAAFAGADDVMRVEVTRAGTLEVAMALHERGLVEGEGSESE